MKIFFIGMSAVVLISVIYSCKEKDPETTPYTVTISFLEPAADDEIMSGSEMHMEVDFDGSKALGNIEVLALNTTTGDTIAYYNIPTNDAFYAFHEHADIIVAEHNMCTITASAWESDYADRISKSVMVHLIP
ncbi:MAG: hypothetical protein R2794_08565 [Chitinophagales bacterium]